MGSQIKIPSLEEVRRLIIEAYKIVKPKYIDEFEGLSDFIGAVEYAYETYVDAKDSGEFWSQLAFFTWGVLTDKEFVSDCEEAFKILTLGGKDCELKEFRKIVNEAGIVTELEIDEVEPVLLANYFLSSAYSLEIDALISEAKKLWEEKINAEK